MNASQTKEVVLAYFNAWTSHNIDKAMAQLADDIYVQGPTGGARSAVEFRPGLEAFAKITKRAEIKSFIVEGDKAGLFYEAELPAPVGVLKIGSFFKVIKGKIQSYEILFDSVEFRKLMGPKK